LTDCSHRTNFERVNGHDDLDVILRQYGSRWTISYGRGFVLTAERRSDDGRAIHYLVAHTARELAAKLRAVEAEGQPS
jgi:hypothetical protein